MGVADALRSELSEALKSVGVSVAPGEVPLEHPSELQNGDYSTSVAMQYTKEANVAPRNLAEKLVAALGAIDGVAKTEIAGAGFINFYLAPQALAASLEKARAEDMWGANETLERKKIMVEYTDPNPFKEFHIGHLMSNAIGESLARLLEFSGAEVKRANYQGDIGPHVAKAIWGLRKLGLDASLPASLGKAYAAGANAYEEDEAAKAEIDAINKKIYDHSDAGIGALYATGREASLKHFEDIYGTLGTKFDYYFFESVTAPKGMEIVHAHGDVFEESDGATVYKGEKDGLHTRVFLTSQGLPTYETKDLGLAELKAETWPFDESITVTAHEQGGYFAVVLAAMKKVMPEIAAKIKHVSHGMMRFAEGKMSSRTGNVVTGESLLRELTEAAKRRASESRAGDTEKLAQD
ncbi:MAG: arginine--tRNA ligase, partial [Patescibacteria group bacterium]|nr:arginine--tRNA ligase [Patescibacteria group bacterium]